MEGNAATAPLVTNQVFGRLEYELTNDITAFGQAYWANAHNAYNGQNLARPYGSSNAINV